MSTDYLIPPDRLATDRVLLRSWMPTDGAALTEAAVHSYEHLAPWMPWAIRDQGVQTSERLVRQFRAKWLLAQDFTIAIFTPDGARVLGSCGFHLRHGPLAKRVAEIGMWIRADGAYRGLGTHVLQTLLTWGFSAWPWRRIVWKCDVDNAASRRVAEKAGMTLEGIARQVDTKVDGTPRDTVWYAALRGR